MDCAEAAKLIHEYLDCHCCEETRLKIQTHLNTCPNCFGKFNFEEGLRDIVKACTKSELPADLCDRLSQMLDKETEKEA